jgi:hypothetical protein
VLGEAEKAPPSILYCTLNPDTGVTVGKINAEAHVLAGAVMVGAAGKTTIQTVLEIVVVEPWV